MVKFFALLFLIVSFSSPTLSDAQKFVLKNYDTLEKIISTYPLQETLLVLDNDDTVTKMPCDKEGNCQYLGGAAWFSWQEDLLGTKSPYRVADTFPELLQVSALLFNISDMQLTNKQLPAILSKLTNGGLRILMETARGYENASSTERQLKALNLEHTQYENVLDLFQKNSLKINNLSSIAGPFHPCKIANARPVIYQQGVMYLSGQNKGVMLKCLIQHYQKHSPNAPKIRNIIFIDDTLKNVEDVYEAFKNEPEFMVNAYHYTAYEAHKKALTSGPQKTELQNKARMKWQKISHSLKENILNPPIPNTEK